jgi:hypothetical protein
MTPKNTICLWYDGTAEQAATFYAQTFPGSQVHRIHRAPADFPAGNKGDVLTVEFTVAGIPCIGLNGGPAFQHSEAFSFQIATEDQEETDRLWNAIVLRLVQGPLGSVLADHAAGADRGHCRRRSRSGPAGIFRDDGHAQDRHCRNRGRAPRVNQAFTR